MLDSFAWKIKQEIIHHNLKNSDKKNLLSGIIATSNFNDEVATFIINNELVFSYITNLLRSLNVTYTNPRKNSFAIDLKTFHNNNLKKERDFFSGIFLASGSISDLSTTSNHLELKFYNEKAARDNLEILINHNLSFKLLNRNGRYFLYCKKIENICDFLKAIEAIDSYYEFEDSKIERDYYNNINRITNFDFYNQQRIADANMTFMQNLEFIKTNNLEHLFNPDELYFFDLKIENIDSSLSELSSILKSKNIAKSRSSLNHSLIKLKKIVSKYKK
ncbi:DNA-binding protein WhiA [Metamycoplasma neophronis]|uniref:Probable cell division protein WhiA n=1 Tax=Metamycoplasma neophronis TaxID=872983 RepID=A0ABY2Z0T0_9BACT|nr:DNA-binding protein WhiA [Metamycoplasma neophronis]TPR53896.1 DNA-binding protein WhiA [Metamycoplasma neophronis]